MHTLIINWCEAHNVELIRDTFGVQATAYKHDGTPIDRVVIEHRLPELPPQSEDTYRAIRACDALAERLLILKPSVALMLNHQTDDDADEAELDS